MAECTHDCSSCAENCASRENASLLAPQNEQSQIKKVIGVVSGKGGVGKSFVSALLAVAMRRAGERVAILDADITGPSIPKLFGLHSGCDATEQGLLPACSKTGIEIMSVNLLLPEETAPVVWRGPVISGTVKQFWTDVIWGEIDWMFVDLPPGTGDVPLTVFQSLPLDGIVIVTSPQELVSMIVERAVRMAELMQIPVVGLIENMSWLRCPDCGKKIHIFGESHADIVAAQHGIPLLANLPMDPDLPRLSDQGKIEAYTFAQEQQLVQALRTATKH